MEEVKWGKKKLASGKAQDIDGFQVVYLKWGIETLAPIIKGYSTVSRREIF